VKIQFLIFETKAPAWVEQARQEYAAKITPFVTFELQTLKSPNADRDSADVKRRREAEILLKHVDERDFLILFDEKGRVAKSSEDFAQNLTRVLESGKTRVLFCIGGPYGFSDEVKKRAQAQWSLSPLTMNHWMAQLMALEQVYRGFTILRGLPYHNR
jgi:23S rRNA (pseudouridine1915-N3)-methyltransferase